jgi:hypothetical protein
MNAWASRRKRIIFFIVLVSLVVLVGAPLFFYFYKTPTCSDQKKNGDESGVDCGGSCTRLCSAEALPLIGKGDPRLLHIATSTYEVVLEVENPNVSASIYRAGYVFKLYEASSSVPIKLIEGTTYIPHGATFAIFEGPLTIGERVPVRASFDWKADTLKWERDTKEFPDLLISDIQLYDTETFPRLEATLKNNSLIAALNIELVALVSDPNGTIVAASKTYVEKLGKGEMTSLAFSWPQAFRASTTAVHILPRTLPDTSFIR